MTRADVVAGLLLVWLLLIVVTIIAAYRNAREADRREQLVDAALEERTLADFAPRPTQKVHDMTTSGALGKDLPTVVKTTGE